MVGNFPFPVHDRRRTRDMAAMSRATAFAVDSMADKLEARKRLLSRREVDLQDVHGFYQGTWPAWNIASGTLAIRATGGTPTIATASASSGFQPDPTAPDDRVGQIAVGWLELFFASGCSVGTGAFGLTLPRRPRITNGMIGYYMGQADGSPFLPVRGICVHNVIGGDDVVSFYQHGAGLLSNTVPGTWDMTNSYLILNLMYEVEEES